MLDVDNATPFLLGRGLIAPDAIVAGDLTIASAARRNRNLRVQGPPGVGYLIKQPDDPALGGRQTLGAEAAFYRFCRDDPAAAEVAGFLPRLIDFDADAAVLVLELIRDAAPLWSYQGPGADRGIPAEVGRALGHALGTVHRVFGATGPAAGWRPAWITSAFPWVLMAHKPGPTLLASISPATYKTLRILQTQEGLGTQLDRLRRAWRPETVIHGDIKSDNVLIRPGEGLSPARAWLVDWELVQVGDPAWDLAGALQDFLIAWTGSMPTAAGLTVEERIGRARQPLGAIRGTIRALWHGYRLAARLDPAEADELLTRAVAFSAARLIQSAYELADEADDLPAPAATWIQIGANLLADPESGRVHLYGIPRDPSRP